MSLQQTRGDSSSISTTTDNSNGLIPGDFVKPILQQTCMNMKCTVDMATLPLRIGSNVENLRLSLQARFQGADVQRLSMGESEACGLPRVYSAIKMADYVINADTSQLQGRL